MLGSEGRIVVTVTLYKPNVRCYGSHTARSPTSDGGEGLFDQIQTTSETRFFGPSGQPAVQVIVPKVLFSHQGSSKYPMSLSPTLSFFLL